MKESCTSRIFMSQWFAHSGAFTYSDSRLRKVSTISTCIPYNEIIYPATTTERSKDTDNPFFRAIANQTISVCDRYKTI